MSFFVHYEVFIFFSGQKVGLLLSPPQWVSAYRVSLSFVLTNTIMLQTSKSDSIEHYIDIINKYKVGAIQFYVTLCTVNTLDAKPYSIF